MVDCEKKNKNTGEMEKRKVTVKVRVEGTLKELTEKFEDTLPEKLWKRVRHTAPIFANYETEGTADTKPNALTHRIQRELHLQI